MGRLVPKKITLSVVGIQHYLTLSTRRMMNPHLPLKCALIREPTNPADPNAIRVEVSEVGPYKGLKLGHMRRQVAEVWADFMDEGKLVITEAWLLEFDSRLETGELLIKFKAPVKFQ